MSPLTAAVSFMPIPDVLASTAKGMDLSTRGLGDPGEEPELLVLPGQPERVAVGDAHVRQILAGLAARARRPRWCSRVRLGSRCRRWPGPPAGWRCSCRFMRNLVPSGRRGDGELALECSPSRRACGRPAPGRRPGCKATPAPRAPGLAGQVAGLGHHPAELARRRPGRGELRRVAAPLRSPLMTGGGAGGVLGSGGRGRPAGEDRRPRAGQVRWALTSPRSRPWSSNGRAFELRVLARRQGHIGRHDLQVGRRGLAAALRPAGRPRPRRRSPFRPSCRCSTSRRWS